MLFCVMETDFIPIDYDYFDFQGKNYAKVIGRNSKGKRVCVIDSCPVYFWAILKPKTSDSKIKQIQQKIIEIFRRSQIRANTPIVLEPCLYRHTLPGDIEKVRFRRSQALAD